MRWSLLLVCLTICSSFVQAQEQENQMMDRIMRPNLSLVNPAQNKKFIAAEGASVDKKFVANSFYAREERSSKSFPGLKNFFAKIFATKKYSRAEAAANARANAEIAFASSQFTNRKSALIRSSSETGKVVKVRDYADSRPFLGRGTRQQQLSEQDHPLPIEEVRELLNKNR